MAWNLNGYPAANTTDRGGLAMRILLVQPDIRPGEIGFHVAAQTEPLALETLAATLPDHDVEILDLRLEADLPAVLQRFSIKSDTCSFSTGLAVNAESSDRIRSASRYTSGPGKPTRA